jgi:general secretion pathway protein D
MASLMPLPRASSMILLLACLLSLSGLARAQANVTLNLKDADISTLIATVSDVTGRNFIVDPRVRGKVTVVSSQPMSAEGVYETFLAALQVQGFAVIRVGEAYKIVPETNARQDGGASGPKARDASDEIVTHVYSLNNVSAAQLVPILRPLVPQWGHLAAYAPSNMLIIADRAGNVARLDRIIRRMDQGGDREIETVRLEHAAASEVVRILTTLAQADQAQDGSAKPATLIADERSNSVLIGGDKSERQKFVDIIGTLDIELSGDGATQVVYLRYASAENLAPILEGYAEQANQAEAAQGGGGEGAGRRAAADSGSRVVADPDTNALIVTAPPKIMRQIRDVIAQLDIRRAQVLVEAVIAEVSADKSSQLGVDWAVFNNDRIAAAGILDPNTLQALGGAVAQGGVNAAGALGLIGQGINIGVGRSGTNTTFGVLIKALQGDGDTNILSTPTLVTLDNQEASFSAGQEVPFLTGSFSNTGVSNQGGVVNPFQTIERRDVGLTLGVTPQINEGNVVKLLLDLEVSSLASGAAGGANLITNKRTLTNTVSVENGQILVIGGLIDDSLTDTERAVPLLGSIPLLGNLFKFRSVEKVKRNLMVFIRPSILRAKSDGDYYTRRKYDAVRAAQLKASQSGVPLVGGEAAVMLPFEEYEAQMPPPPPTELPDGLPPAPAATP